MENNPLTVTLNIDPESKRLAIPHDITIFVTPRGHIYHWTGSRLVRLPTHLTASGVIVRLASADTTYRKPLRVAPYICMAYHGMCGDHETLHYRDGSQRNLAPSNLYWA